MMAKDAYDAVVIGAGPAGMPLAESLAHAGKRTALVARGTPAWPRAGVDRAPWKMMIAAARVAHLARRAAEYGVRASAIAVDMGEIRERNRRMAETLRVAARDRLRSIGKLDLITGDAGFTDPQTIEVTTDDGQMRLLTAENVFIDTGSRPAVPVVEGLNQVRVLNSTSIMELDEVPEHLLVIGGGVVGVELAQAFRRFGSEVTIIQRNQQLLAQEDADVAREVANILLEDGVSVLTGTEAKHVEPTDGRRIHLAAASLHAGEREITGSHLLIAAGRVPDTEALNLPAAGIETDGRGYIRVNDLLQTTVPHIYALGAVTGEPPFAHVAYDDFRIMRQNLLEGGQVTKAGRILSYTVLMDPQLGRVGLTEHEARARMAARARETAPVSTAEAAQPVAEPDALAEPHGIRVGKMPMRRVSRALEMDETRGFMKVVVDAQNDRVLGCAILGVSGGEIASILQMAMVARLPYSAIRDTCFAHPTLAQSLNDLFRTIDS